MNQNYKKILKIIKKAGQLALDLETHLDIKKKQDGIDIATQADHQIEEMLYKEIKNFFPEEGFWGEENEELRNDQDYTWFVDPIDGTKYYAAGIPLWSISVARVKKGEKIPEFSAIYIPKENNLFFAEKGKGAFLNEVLIKNLGKNQLNKVTLALDFSPSPDDSLNNFVYSRLPKIFNSFYRVRFLGCGTLNTVWTSTGFFGCCIKYFQGTKQFNDVVAGLLIAQETGLNVDFQTLENGLDRIVICNKKLLPKVLEVIS
ncbi:MAG: inositol monophosphatase family protein [Candidatus Dojkabacteria bacterium]